MSSIESPAPGVAKEQTGLGKHGRQESIDADGEIRSSLCHEIEQQLMTRADENSNPNLTSDELVAIRGDLIERPSMKLKTMSTIMAADGSSMAPDMAVYFTQAQLEYRDLLNEACDGDNEQFNLEKRRAVEHGRQESIDADGEILSSCCNEIDQQLMTRADENNNPNLTSDQLLAIRDDLIERRQASWHLKIQSKIGLVSASVIASTFICSATAMPTNVTEPGRALALNGIEMAATTTASKFLSSLPEWAWITILFVIFVVGIGVGVSAVCLAPNDCVRKRGERGEKIIKKKAVVIVQGQGIVGPVEMGKRQVEAEQEEQDEKLGMAVREEDGFKLANEAKMGIKVGRIGKKCNLKDGPIMKFNAVPMDLVPKDPIVKRPSIPVMANLKMVLKK